MIIRSAEFVTSGGKPSEYPPADLPEVAFAGRSNVGKSSLINTLVNRKKLVRTSSSPGRTRRLNFFSVNGVIRFVDLPGYGYAKVSKTERGSWGAMMETYLSRRETLAAVVLIVDARREPDSLEAEFLAWIAAQGRRRILAVTKADKLSGNERRRVLDKVAAALGEGADEVILFSSKTGLGRDLMWRALAQAAGIEDEIPKKAEDLS
ncbi:MAG: ribosome biogenesis GTP-binding protein YihA/YsxC [Proteobacteria bacterium]|nr:ribosome biogenesis GTP-binding protein YihA/YsxC [Pseudomonadota bacterium]